MAPELLVGQVRLGSGDADIGQSRVGAESGEQRLRDIDPDKGDELTSVGSLKAEVLAALQVVLQIPQLVAEADIRPGRDQPLEPGGVEVVSLNELAGSIEIAPFLDGVWPIAFQALAGKHESRNECGSSGLFSEAAELDPDDRGLDLLVELNNLTKVVDNR